MVSTAAATANTATTAAATANTATSKAMGSTIVVKHMRGELDY
jgi:hypothetical protein